MMSMFVLLVNRVSAEHKMNSFHAFDLGHVCPHIAVVI